tara:strand:+ start:321 stop:491 length:171 start_codon:yes stop_codon:yes gene_type:complete
MKIYVQYQTQHHHWRPYGTFNTELSAYKIATARAKATRRRFRLVDKDKRLLDLVEP